MTTLDQTALEQAALYALSALTAEEMAAVERDRRAQAEFWAEVRSLRDAAAGLAEVGPRVKPTRDLWPAIRARIGHAPEAPAHVPPQLWKHWPGSARSSPVVPAREGPFEPTDIAGISVRRLFVDEAAERVTMLVRMQAGSAYPAHRHAGVEECYVLEGDLSIGDETEMEAGDYQRMDTGSLHPIQSTRRGCLLLVTSSRHDELVA
jgi:quercetin dioxygenase-like cupin family protein